MLVIEKVDIFKRLLKKHGTEIWMDRHDFSRFGKINMQHFLFGKNINEIIK